MPSCFQPEGSCESMTCRWTVSSPGRFFDQQEFSKVGVETTAYLRIVYPVDPCPEALD